MALTHDNLLKLVQRIKTLPPDKETLQDQLLDLSRLLEACYCEPMLVEGCIEQLKDPVIKDTMIGIAEDLPLMMNDKDPRTEFLLSWRFETGE
jgi:hypothetical protein